MDTSSLAPGPSSLPVARRSPGKTARSLNPQSRRAKLPWNFAEWFVLSQTFLPALLYLPGTQPLRIGIRVASYGISLVALFYCWVVAPARGRRVPLSPAAYWLGAALVYLAIMIVHPTTNTILAGVGQVGIYLAIMAPVFWAPAFVESPERLRRLLWLLLFCSGVNAFVGVMQVRNPNFWMPQELSSVIMQSDYGLGTVVYEGANGQMIIRPPGLLDTPGAVAGPGAFALFLGLVFAAEHRKWWVKICSFIFAALGAAAVFLSLVRSSFLIAVGMLLAYLVLQIVQRRFGAAIQLAVVAVVAITLAFLQAVSLGGDNLTDRFQTILAGNPADFYYENRGNQVANGFTDLLPQYPFGAGLGRYGMMYSYFGNPNSPTAPLIWVEIQVPAWIVDGGIIMLLLYPAALLIALWEQGTMVARHPDGEVRALAGIILAANLGLLALCSSYAVFLSPLGTQFWFFSGALYGLSRMNKRRSRGSNLPAGRGSPRLLLTGGAMVPSAE